MDRGTPVVDRMAGLGRLQGLGLWQRLGPWQRLGLAALAGAALTAGHAPLDLPLIWFAALPVLGLLFATAPTGRAAAWLGWAAGTGYFATGLHWIFHPFAVRAAAEPDLWLMWTAGGAASVLAMGAGLGLFWLAAFWAAFRLARRWTPSDPLAAMATLAAMLTVAGIARTHVLTGFPWALPGYVWVETPLMQMAAWAGPHGMTLLTLLGTGLPGVAALAAGGKARVAVPVLCLGAVAAGWVAGAMLLPATDAGPQPGAAQTDSPRLRIVQPNAPQHLKWQPGHREEFYRRAVEATAAPRPLPIDAVIWPETAMFFLPESRPGEIGALMEIARAPLIAGALAVEGPREDETWYNALFVFRPDGTIATRYDKHHLVPFGEYIPLPWLTDLFGLRKFGIGGGFGRGPGPQTISIPGLPGFSALICYEAIFPHNIIARGPRPDWLLQITNDAWFGDFAGPQQHLAQARIRAIEQGLPMVRAANTGISAVIDAYGRVAVSLPLGQYGYFDALLPPPRAPTLYARTGDWPGYGALVLLLAGLVVLGLRRRPA